MNVNAHVLRYIKGDVDSRCALYWSCRIIVTSLKEKRTYNKQENVETSPCVGIMMMMRKAKTCGTYIADLSKRLYRPTPVHRLFGSHCI